uniref:VWFA domain-containing protein n=1 Tax=Chromera velia CCMP2878 TaxID=1169474 RepID=A0A0G4G985_9ALVE|eukprot:Cvel_4361.t1-p1 / transcript=Cvel_4361.t1 / gene=Cvel_4361 / organism=Chromera_velia_CCMP2878 / gene_product=hypothetical protein / transcript_product=hypothetical protein / location=Cvel_scaffold189:25999-27483(+) / protein_length=442 / sequence_SO=supercontig / SO=protein_coding / is_pseudo=false
MRHARFVCEEEVFTVGSRKYAPDDHGKAEMCHMHCQSLGRGHVHPRPCPNHASGPRTCDNDGLEGRRHARIQYKPNPEEPRDEFTHAAYWDSLNFEEPVNDPALLQQFTRCPHFCPHESHLERGEPSWCTKPLWHEPFDRNSRVGRNERVSADGHVFACSCASPGIHLVFMLDCSTSMGRKDVRPSRGWRHASRIIKGFQTIPARFVHRFPRATGSQHTPEWNWSDVPAAIAARAQNEARTTQETLNCRLGAALEAIEDFIERRRQTAGGAADRVTISLFNSGVLPNIASVPIADFDMQRVVENPVFSDRIWGGTDFTRALQHAVSRMNPDHRFTAIILLSDGEAEYDQAAIERQFRARLRDGAHPPRFHGLQLRPEEGSTGQLQSIVQLFRRLSLDDRFASQSAFHEVEDREGLIFVYREISESMRKPGGGLITRPSTSVA